MEVVALARFQKQLQDTDALQRQLNLNQAFVDYSAQDFLAWFITFLDIMHNAIHVYPPKIISTISLQGAITSLGS